MSWNDKLNDTRNQLRGLNKTIPDATRAFGALGKAVKEGGCPSSRPKSLSRWASLWPCAATPALSCMLTR